MIESDFYTTAAGRDHFRDQLQSIRYCVQEVRAACASIAIRRRPVDSRPVLPRADLQLRLPLQLPHSDQLRLPLRPQQGPAPAQVGPHGDAARDRDVRDRAKGRGEAALPSLPPSAASRDYHLLTTLPPSARSSGSTRRWRRPSRAWRATRCALSATPLCRRAASYTATSRAAKGDAEHDHRPPRTPPLHRDGAGGEDRLRHRGPGGPRALRGGRGGLRGALLPRLRRVQDAALRGVRRRRLAADAPALDAGRRVLPDGAAGGLRHGGRAAAALHGAACHRTRSAAANTDSHPAALARRTL